MKSSILVYVVFNEVAYLEGPPGVGGKELGRPSKWLL